SFPFSSSDPGSDQIPVRVRPPWQDIAITDLEPDNGLLVTHVNQTRDLLRVQGREAHASDTQISEEWLLDHNLESMKLTIGELLSKGKVIWDNDHPTMKHIQFSADIVNDFEYRLFEAVELYHSRIRWLMEGSRRMFGLIKGTRVGVLVDTSDANCELGRLQNFQEGLLSLIDEQLYCKKQLYFLSFSTDVSPLWNHARDVNIRILHEARQWVQQLQPCGGCNLLKAMKKVLTVKELNSLVVISGTCPDQTSDIFIDYIQQSMLGRKLPVHVVAYDCSNHLAHATLKKLAEVTGGRYHCYSSDSKDPIYTSSDVYLLWKESQKALDVLGKIKEMRQGMIGDALISIMQEISTEVAKLPPTCFLPRPVCHDHPLCIEMPHFVPKTSSDWLKKNGLKAKKLNLYQVLAPNAFSLVEEFVPILRKTVSSTLHEKAMMQFEWHDGTMKNIHVDPPLLYEYQKQLDRIVRTYERRIEWLTTMSRRLWGTVCEKRVIVLIDISGTNSMYIIHIQHSLRLLLEEQMTNKDCFNIIVFGSEVKAWQPEMVPPTPENLQSAWKWILGLRCEGSRNVVGALQRAIEVDPKDKVVEESQGIYLFTSGVPDQEKHAVGAYVAEVCGGCELHLHVCLFAINELELHGAVPARYATPTETTNILKELAYTGNGRFHWFRETGIIESDDINIILSEIEKAVNYSQKATTFLFIIGSRASVQMKVGILPTGEKIVMAQKKSSLTPPPPYTHANINLSAKEDQEAGNFPAKALTWRPNSAKATIPPAWQLKDWCQDTGEKEGKHKKRTKISLSVFYTEEGKNVGLVYKDYPKTKSVRKTIPFAALSKEEEICSTKEKWMKKYSMKKLKLDLHKLVSGPDCTHQKKMVPTLHKKISAKYCGIFPSVEVNGVVKHLQFQPKELEEYIEQVERVLRRYIQRMQWLLSVGSRRLFGTILENKVCILLDTSGSMDPYLPEVKKELTSLIWEQLRKKSISFNLMSFSENVEVWQEHFVESTDEACHDAAQWVAKVKAHGKTCTLEALQRAFCFEDLQAVYLLTDGKPDASCSFILKETERLMQRRNVKIHTISFNCSDSTANEFLKKLASQTGGRYHRCYGDIDGHFVAHRMLTEGFTDEDDPNLPAFEGDDLKRLAEEIRKARQFLTQARSFRALLLEKRTKPFQTDVPIGNTLQPCK
uniref:von Willebrand factor A domain containing 3A n=1 Tax=Latimeria chalumnae TaxID=7897 RepID=H3A0J3_LATCH